LAYGIVLLLQGRVLWNIWRYRDVTFGDTSSYYIEALAWQHHLRDNFADAPLYGDFLGTIHALVGDVHDTIILHRVLVVVVAGVLVVAITRALLGPYVGLIVGLWWVVIPANYDLEYEVHLFGAIPLLLAVLLVVRTPSRCRLGLAFALLLLDALLARNEVILPAAIVGAAILIREVRLPSSHRPRVRTYLWTYGVPTAIVVALATGAYVSALYPGWASIQAKHRLNTCQIFAFNYQQRHPKLFTSNPFTDCSPLMQREFHQPMPTMLQAVTANPKAMAAYVAWNLRLLPSGLQIALFGATATGDNPDYFPVREHRAYTLWLSVLTLAIIVWGAVAMRRESLYWRAWARLHAWALGLVVTLSGTAVLVALTQRPRAEYIYMLTLSLLLLVGASTLAVVRRLGLARFLGVATLVVAIGLVVGASSPYHRTTPRPLEEALTRLASVRPQLQRPGSVLIASGYNFETCSYLAADYDRHCTSPGWPELQAKLANGEPIARVLNQAGATIVYVDPILAQDPAVAKIVRSPKAYGWQFASQGTGPDGSWGVLRRA
jgi:hypothetical protein